MSFSASEYCQIINTHFAENANMEIAEWMSKYMRGKFAFYGLKSPTRRIIQKAIIQDHGLPPIEHLPELMEQMWQAEHRDLQLFGIDLLDKYIKKVDADFIEVLEKLILTKSWWDTVDLLAIRMVGHLFKRFPHHVPDYPNKWMASDNIWLQRSAIIFQLKYKKTTNTDLLFRYILQLKDTKEFFIQKGAGWALREYSKTDWELIYDFINQEEDLAPLTKREGLKWMKAKGVL